MAQLFSVHPTHPQHRLIARAAQIVRDGGVIAYPTDSCYAFGCHIGDKSAMERVRKLRDMDERRHLTLMCRDLSEIAVYARVDNAQYRFLRQFTPGSYTFILEATKEVPRRLMHPKRKTIGIRIPDHPVALALLEELGEPLLSSTAQLAGDDDPLNDGAEIRARLEHQLELVLDAGPCGIVPSTVVDLTSGAPVVTRVGRGDATVLGAG